MTNHNNRKNSRIDTHNLISYVSINENDEPVGQGMGRTLNISEGGILLETHTPIDPQYTISFTMNLEDEMMDVKGKVAYNKKRDDGKFETGIQFIKTDESRIRMIKQFVVMFKDEIE
jgi:hypothetical protein